MSSWAFVIPNRHKTVRQTITIANSESGLLVTEDIEVNNTGDEDYTSIQFWIQQDAQDIQILDVKENKELIPETAGNVYTCNLTKHNLTIEPNTPTDFRLSYTLPTNVENFEKTLSYDTTSLSVLFNQEELYHGEHLSSGASSKLLLYKVLNL